MFPYIAPLCRKDQFLSRQGDFSGQILVAHDRLAQLVHRGVVPANRRPMQHVNEDMRLGHSEVSEKPMPIRMKKRVEVSDIVVPHTATRLGDNVMRRRDNVVIEHESPLGKERGSTTTNSAEPMDMCRSEERCLAN